VIILGYSLGTAVDAPFANWLIPRFEWKSFFLVGGAATMGRAAVLLSMPLDSVRFLASTGKNPDRIAATLRRISRLIPLENSAFVVLDEARLADFKPLRSCPGAYQPADLGRPHRQFVRRILILITGHPRMFEALHHKRAEATNASAINSVVGTPGGLLLMRFTGRFGAIAITLMAFLTCTLPLIASLGGLVHDPFRVVAPTTGGFLIGGHIGILSVCRISHSSAYRAHGAACATPVAKMGSIARPTVGGWVFATSLPCKCLHCAGGMLGRIHSLHLLRQAIAPVDPGARKSGSSVGRGAASGSQPGAGSTTSSEYFIRAH
jgi:AAHS family 4-hydroxybenzoate transporter-like MFS transporter